MNEKNAAFYSTSDIVVAAFLRTKNFKLEKVERENGRRMRFIFQDENGRPDLIVSLINRSEKVEPLGFQDELRNLKALCQGA